MNGLKFLDRIIILAPLLLVIALLMLAHVICLFFG
jgi:hypothetical protein